MTQISISDLEANPDKYVDMAQTQDILITKDGKVVAKLVKQSKREAWDSLQRLFQGINIPDQEVDWGKPCGEEIW